MNIAEKAFAELFPDKNNARTMKVRYSRAFRPYNSNVKYTPFAMTFSLSRDWKPVSEEIKIGLMQSLLVKIYHEKHKTMNMDLYENFLRNIGEYAKSEESEPVLDESFERINAKYFEGMMEKPNLRWGSHSFAKLGSYEFGANTITMSRILEEDSELLDYVMYHEMLHKKQKFHTKGGRSYHHTKQFREKEKAFENPDIETKLKRFLVMKRRRRSPMSTGRVKANPLKKWIERFF
jgi:hypothetical protein